MSDRATAIVTSAILGILSGAACATQPLVPAASASSADKHACGNHEPGKCAAATATPPPADKPFSITRTETIAPGKQFELNLSFSSGAKANAKFKASASLAWNVHSHPAGGVVEHQKGAAATGDISFQAPEAGVYSFMWTNDGSAPVTLDVSVDAERGVAAR